MMCLMSSDEASVRMDLYEIIITPDAADDLSGLRSYIADALLAPDTARAYLDMLYMEMKNLSTLPKRSKYIDDEPWHSRGIRKIIVKNFVIYYRVEEFTMRVYILNVIYARRDQLRMLAQIKID